VLDQQQHMIISHDYAGGSHHMLVTIMLGVFQEIGSQLSHLIPLIVHLVFCLVTTATSAIYLIVKWQNLFDFKRLTI